MLRTFRWILVLAPLALLLTGCLAMGQSFALANIVAALVAAGTGSIAIVAIDRREWIRSGAKKPSYAGSLRGGFGNPFDVVVKANVPLSDTFTNVIAKSLKKKGFDAKPIIAAPNAEESQVIQQLGASGATKSLLIGIENWQSDTYTNVSMVYLINAKVLDAQGNVLAQHAITGEEDGKDNLKGSVMNPAGYAKKVVPKAFQDQIERLLNHDDIVKALA